jgi:hypothetical protein
MKLEDIAVGKGVDDVKTTLEDPLCNVAHLSDPMGDDDLSRYPWMLRKFRADLSRSACPKDEELEQFYDLLEVFETLTDEERLLWRK